VLTALSCVEDGLTSSALTSDCFIFIINAMFFLLVLPCVSTKNYHTKTNPSKLKTTIATKCPSRCFKLKERRTIKFRSQLVLAAKLLAPPMRFSGYISAFTNQGIASRPLE